MEISFRIRSIRSGADRLEFHKQPDRRREIIHAAGGQLKTVTMSTIEIDALLNSDDRLLRKVEQFIFHEAELADRHRFDDWMALWTEDALYWAPCNEDDVDPSRHVSIIYEDRKGIAGRLARLKGKHAHAQNPRSRIARVISNIQLGPNSSAGDLAATANFVIGEVRLNRQEVWIGRYRYMLREVDGGLKMVEKKIVLLLNDTPVGNLTFIL